MTHIIYRYPKLLLLACSFTGAYLLYHWGYFDAMATQLNGHGYVSAFIGGLLFSFGFTAPFGIAIFAEIAPTLHIVPGALIGGFGALLTDILIFEVARFSIFHDELHRLRDTSIARRIHALLHHESLPEKIREYILWSFAGLIIASPFPDEIGVTLISGVMDVDSRKFSIFCWILNTIGVAAILLIAR